MLGPCFPAKTGIHKLEPATASFFGFLCESFTQQRISDGFKRSHPDSLKPGPALNSSCKLQVKHWLNTSAHLGTLSTNFACRDKNTNEDCKLL